MQKIVSFLFIFSVLMSFSCSNASSEIKETVTIFHAGSLSKPLREIKEAFHKEHPSIKILTEPDGSVACARKITDLNKDCDIILSADYKVIDALLVPHYSDSAYRFASNEMVIAYHKNSKLGSEINIQNWFEVLTKENVTFGRSDEHHDPCGYRTILMWQLAEKFYDRKNIENDLIRKNKRYIRPKASDLIALLDANALDYAFLYKSVAIQQKLNFLELPNEINLSDAKQEAYYKSAQITIKGNKKKQLIMEGEPMLYGISILKESKSDKSTQLLYDYIFSKKGRAIFKKNGQELF